LQSHPLVSIITTTYNHSRFIGKCVDSVLSQTYPHWEQIIIDDGSTDETGEIVCVYRDPRIRYEHQPNKGPFELAATYNRALELAKGDLIAILEGDDFWPLGKLSTQVPEFADPDVVLAYGEAVDVSAIGEEQKMASHTTRLRKQLPSKVLCNNPAGSATRHMLLAEGRSLVSPSTVILRRSALEMIGGFQGVPGLPLTDYPTFIELSLKGVFHYSPETLGYRRRHEESITVHHGRTIYEKVSEFTLQFLASHSEQVPLSAFELHSLEENWRGAEDKLHFSEGRALLLQGLWSDARRHFRRAAKSSSSGVRLAAIAGVLCSWLHTDVEPLMKLGGRSDLRGRTGTAGTASYGGYIES
jgi:glycosyltransferase involved in cell wall biosynthesis